MELETHIQRIKQLAAQRADENWEFRGFLKASPVSSKKLDAAFLRHYQEVAAAFDCTACGNCCREALPELTPLDVKRLTAGLNLAEEQVHQRYLQAGEEPNSTTFKARPCPFLSDHKCMVYDLRPDACRSYPHLHQPDRVFSLTGIVANYSICPIVFNVFERLKKELWKRLP